MNIRIMDGVKKIPHVKETFVKKVKVIQKHLIFTHVKKYLFIKNES